MVYDKILYKIIITLLPTILSNVTPLIRDNLNELIKQLEEKARKTPNPIDDLLVDFLKSLLNVD